MTTEPAIPTVTFRTTLTLHTGQTVPVKEICYALGKTPAGIVYRVVYFTDTTREQVKGCKARYLDGEWEEFTGSLTTKFVRAEPVADRSTAVMPDPYGGTVGERYIASKRDRNDDTKLAP